MELYSAAQDTLSDLATVDTLVSAPTLEQHRRDLELAQSQIAQVVEQLRGAAEELETTAREQPKTGTSAFTSVYNPSGPVAVGLDVAYRSLKREKGPDGTWAPLYLWIQCEVLEVLGDGKVFEIRDVEPDDNNRVLVITAKSDEIMLIPTEGEARELVAYPYGTKVLARFPETTTFYPAEVAGTRRDGRCRLRFEGDDVAEREILRRLVLPYVE